MVSKLRYWFEQDWNEGLYWKMRMYIQRNREGGVLASIVLMILRRTEAKKCCATGISLKDNCCQIETPLKCYHGLNGIVIAQNTKIGKNVTIFQHVTIAESDKSKTTIIEDDVQIGAGAVIMNNVHIGKGAKVGANAVVVCDVPEGTTAVGVPARIIEKIEAKE